MLIPLGLWETIDDSVGTVKKPLDIRRLLGWRNEVEEDYIEEFEEPSNMKVEEIKEVKIIHSDSSGIKAVEGWTEKVNMGQWEEEI